MKSTSRFSKNKKGITCLNCEQPISDNDNFCSNCGQVNDELPLSISQFISEFFAGFFSFDSRFFNTFVPLLFKPGKVSKDYVEGKRRRYVNPFQLYLHVTIVFFLLMGLFSKIDEYKIDILQQEENNSVIDSTSTLGVNIDSDDTTPKDSVDLSLIKPNLDTLSNQKINKLNYYIDSLFSNSNFIDQLKNKDLSQNQKDSIFKNISKSNLDFITKALYNQKDFNIDDLDQLADINEYKKHSLNYMDSIFKKTEVDYVIPEKFKVSTEDEIFNSIVKGEYFDKIKKFMDYDKENKNANINVALNDLGYDKTKWNVFYYKKAQDINKIISQDSTFISDYANDFISRISIALFFLLPIFALFAAIIYFRHQYNYTEHLVFIFNVQTVFFILLMFFILFDRILKTDFGIALFFLIFAFYLYKSMRNFYEQGRIKTFIKYLLLNSAFILLASIGSVVIAFLAFVL